MKSLVGRSGTLRSLACALLAATCRDYSSTAPASAAAGGNGALGPTAGISGDLEDAGTTDGGAFANGGSSHQAGTTDGNVGGEAGTTVVTGGRAGARAATGGSRGDASAGDASAGDDAGGTGTSAGGTGMSAGGAGTSAGGAGTAGTGAQMSSGPALYSAVRLFVDGQPVCGGTLITNSWVLTADHCFDGVTTPGEVTIAFGMDAEHPDQTRLGSELVHFPGNTAGHKTRDLALLGTSAPFLIDGSVTEHYVPLGQDYGVWLGTTYVCVGWDMQPDPLSDDAHLKLAKLTPTAITDLGGGSIGGDATIMVPCEVWWENTNRFDLEHGTLFTPTDAGSACFYLSGTDAFLMTVQSANPAKTHAGSDNPNEEAYAESLGDIAAQTFVKATLFGRLPDAPDVVFSGPATACSPDRGTVDLFGVAADGTLSHYRRESPDVWEATSAAWVQQPSLGSPPEEGLLSSQPGVLCRPDGSIDVIATSETGGLWWQHQDPGGGGFSPAWSKLPGAPKIASGVSLIGQGPGMFDLFARRADADDLVHVHYDTIVGWSPWEYWSGGYAPNPPMLGTPAARMGTPQWVDVFVRYSGYDTIQVATHDLDSWGWSYIVQPSTSDPAVASWSAQHIDSFGRDENSHLTLHQYDQGWSSWVVDTGLVLPDGELTTTTREPGHFDVFVSGAGHPLWHATWPRSPVPPP